MTDSIPPRRLWPIAVLGRIVAACAIAPMLALAPLAAAQPAAPPIASIDHLVDSRSQSPSFPDLPIKLALRERIRTDLQRPADGGRGRRTGDKVVLFVHGGAFPGAPDFDLDHQDYSWMAFLAAHGFDAYAVDLTGYGRSSRPGMDDKCSVVPAQRPIVQATGCGEASVDTATSLASDWADIDAAVDFIRRRTGAARVHLIGWSGGGPRVGGYAARHPDKVSRVVLVAPAYLPTAADITVARKTGGPTAVTTRDMMMARWNRDETCPDQFDPAVRDIVWSANLAADPVGAGWGPGVVRSPTTSDRYVWPKALAERLKAPVLMLVGKLDRDVPPQRVRNLYEDVGSTSKVLVDIDCASHFLVYERARRTLHAASLEWLTNGTYLGSRSGVLAIDRRGDRAD